MLARSLIVAVALLVTGLSSLAIHVLTDARNSLVRYSSDIDCDDLVFREIAQHILERHPDDPFNLDPSGDGVACSLLPARDTITQAAGVPSAPDSAPTRATAPAASPSEPPTTASPSRNERPATARTARTNRRQPREDGLRAELNAAVRDISVFWKRAARRSGWNYTTPTARLLRIRALSTDCGPLESGGGPAYWSFHQTIVIDLPIMRAVEPFRDPFLMRVIVAHEWAHHVQLLTGYQKETFPDSPGEVLSLQMELQADCLSGVWAQHAVETGEATDDVRDAVALVYLTGDLPGSPLLAPDAHGSGDMRAGAFLFGLEGGTVTSCEEVILQLQ